jgi:hypothetical protein
MRNVGERSRRAWAVRSCCWLTLAVAAFVGLSSGSAAALITRPLLSQFGSFANPQALAVDQATGDVYVLDVGTGAISKFGSDLAPKSFSALGGNVLDGAGSGDCAGVPTDCDQTPQNGFAFDQPDAAQVAVDNSGGVTDGDIYVTNSLNATIDVFASSGAYLGELTGTSGGGFTEACGVAVDPAGSVYVGDFSNSIVHKFVPSANPPVNGDSAVDFSIPNPPCEVAADSAGNVFANEWEGVVRKFDALGTFEYTIGGASILALSVDPTSGHVFVVDAGQVGEYDASGALAATLVATFGSMQVGSPAGVAVDGSAGKVYVSDGSSGKVAVFGPLTTLPDVTTGGASNLQPTGGTIAGTVGPVGIATTWQFEYGTDAAYGSVAPATPGDAGSGGGTVPVSTALTGLEPNTLYHYRLDATNVNGTARGADETFTTSGPPVVRGGTASAVETKTADIGAALYSGLADTTYHFELGTSTGYGETLPAPDADLGAGPGFQHVSAHLDDLMPQTIYHWRLVATNQFGTTDGADHQFVTSTLRTGDTVPRPPGSLDGRGYELVSQPRKDGNQVNVVVAAANGNSLLYQLLSGGAPGSNSGVAVLSAHRTVAGWISQNALPTRLQMLKSQYFIEATTPDASNWVGAAKDGLGGTDGSPGADLARLSDAGAQTLLHSFQVDFGPSGIDVVASDDLQHVFAIVPETIDPSHVAGTNDVYDFGSGTPVLVSRMPGTDQAPSCGLTGDGATMDFPGGAANAASEHWSSSDGSRVFFSTSGDTCGGPRELYMRNVTAGSTTLISGPPVGGDPDNGIDRFLQATPNASQVFFRTATSLVAADDADGHNSDMDVYRWTSATGQLLCVTCAIPAADVPIGSAGSSNAVVSEDGSHVYFLSAVKGADAPAPGTAANPNVYVWRAGDDSTSFISQIDINGTGLAAYPGANGEVTPDGNILIFRSNDSGLDAISAADNGGFEQFYRYDDRDRSITCVSCPPGGATRDVPDDLARPLPPVAARARAVTDDGSIVFFPTLDALVPEDVNQGPDIYEWHNGTVKLITNGITHYPPGVRPHPISVSADGRDFFFLDQANLTAQAQDGAAKLYDARVGGGFAQPAGPAACEGDQCQGRPAQTPALLEPSSASVIGTGNARMHSVASFVLGKVSAAQRARLARTGLLTLSVRASVGGKVAAIARSTIRGRARIVARASKVTRAAGVVRLSLRLSGAARRALARQGRSRIVVDVSFSKVRSRRQLVLSLKVIGHGH